MYKKYFRVPTVTHARDYLAAGAKVWVFQFDTDEHLSDENQWLNGKLPVLLLYCDAIIT